MEIYVGGLFLLFCFSVTRLDAYTQITELIMLIYISNVFIYRSDTCVAMSFEFRRIRDGTLFRWRRLFFSWKFEPKIVHFILFLLNYNWKYIFHIPNKTPSAVFIFTLIWCIAANFMFLRIIYTALITNANFESLISEIALCR